MVHIFKNISVPYKNIYFLKFGLIKLTLEHTMKVQSESRFRVPLFLKFGDRWGCVIKNTPWTIYPRERDLVPFVHKAKWAPELVGTGVEILAPLRNSIPGPSPSAASHYINCAIPDLSVR
jgi:hypothetical protein